MVLNAAVQMLREADELKQKILKFKSGTSMLQERSLWSTQQELQKVYQKVLVLDLDYALEKKVEQDLWNIGFKQQIEALQAITKDRKNPLRSEAQAMLSWVLQAAAGFYLCLLHQICTTFKLDLPFRRRASLVGCVETWGAGGAADGGAARYACQHCLVHLGDLARYRHQLTVAHCFYRHAVVVSAQCGQPYNQLALVSLSRGRRLAALYWHVRSLLVRAPFPPANNNLARTLRTTANSHENVLPVIPGVTSPSESGSSSAKTRLDSHSYVTEFIRVVHLIHSAEDLDTAAAIVETLNTSLIGLIAVDSFDAMTLIKMVCILIWLVQSCTEDFKVDSSCMSEAEARATQLSESLCAGAVLALALPNYTMDTPLRNTLPPLKVWLQWSLAIGPRGPMFRASRPALWTALAATFNKLIPDQKTDHCYDTVPLSEDEELHGFLPLEQEMKSLKFADQATWETYGGRVPEVDPVNDNDTEGGGGAGEVPARSLRSEPALEHRVRARRLVLLAQRLANIFPDYIAYQVTEGTGEFIARATGAGAASAQLAALAELARPAPPIVISEADFREKVREKRVGILKPQGSLERAREERAMASTQEEVEVEASEESKEDKKEARKPRVNIAMAAIMRKQEETNKQVKFITPPPTPDSISDSTDTKDQDKPKVIQPKAIKSLANLPIGKKTGGILSLKDKSAGYPHLVNAEPEVKKEKEEKKEVKPSQGSSQNSPNYQQKREPSWPSAPPQNPYNDPRMNFPKNYSVQSPALNFNPSYPPPNVNNQGIRLPVVNPKEIDVRTAALQKQNSRQDAFSEGHKFNQNYQISGDKKNFLNDLPPRFANQYRYWQNAQDSQYVDNKFRDDSFKQNNSLFNNQQRPSWPNQQLPDYQPPTPWWKPENPPPNFNTNYTVPMTMQPNFYAPQLSNPYQQMNTYNQPNQTIGQQKETIISPPNYLQPNLGQPLQTLESLVSSANFNSSLNSFGSYAPTVSYDSAMYPQFGNKLGYQPLQMKSGYQGNKDVMEMGGLNFNSNMMEMQQRNMNMNFKGPMNSEGKEQLASGEGTSGDAANTYSLFSGADSAAWPHQTHAQQQSLWSGPGPSPLERLLEQQKQVKPPSAPQ